MVNEIIFAGLSFKGLSKQDILESVSDFKHIVTLNAEYIVKAQKDEKLKKIINNNLSTFDGQVPYFFAKIRYRNLKFEKISGSDFIYDACQFAKINNKKVFLLGGKQFANSKSISTLEKRFGISIDGFSPEYKKYPFKKNHNDKILHQIFLSRPQILFVGFGAVKQDYWIEDNKTVLKSIGVELAIGCGGTFEFVAGEIKRAPKLIQRMGLEGVYRFIQEPKYFRLKRLIISLRVLLYIFK